MRFVAAIAISAVFLLAAPARADVALRIGAETMLVDRGDGGSVNIADSFQPAANVMLSYVLPTSILSLDGELSQGLILSGLCAAGGTCTYPQRGATVLRLGVTVSPPLLPIYVRGAIPIRLADDPIAVGLRGAAGVTLNLLLLKLYGELGADLPLFATTDGAPSAFSRQRVFFGAGAQVQF